MIAVTQGYEQGSGLSLFLKAICSLPKKEQQDFVLFCFEKTLEKTLRANKLSRDSVDHLRFSFLCGHDPQSTVSLQQAYCACKKGDILLTLPTKKDQLFFEQKRALGHTDYLRKITKKQDLSMIFHFKESTLLFLTDHIPLAQVTKQITSDLIEKKLSCCLEGMKKHLQRPHRILFSRHQPPQR